MKQVSLDVNYVFKNLNTHLKASYCNSPYIEYVAIYTKSNFSGSLTPSRDRGMLQDYARMMK